MLSQPIVLCLVFLGLPFSSYSFDLASLLGLAEEDGPPSRLQFEGDFRNDVNLTRYTFLGQLYRMVPIVDKFWDTPYLSLGVIVPREGGRAWMTTTDTPKELAKDRHDASKWNSYRIVYRCYPTNRVDYPHRYTLKSVPIDEISFSKGQGVWYLTYVEERDPDCQADYETEESRAKPEEIMGNAAHEETIRFYHYIETGLPLTRQVFEEAFLSKAQMAANPQLTFLFSRKGQTTRDIHSDVNKALIPQKDCLVTLLPATGRGVLTEKCVQFITETLKTAPGFEAILLPFRCYKKASSFDDYELLNGTIRGMAREDGQHMIYFKVPQRDSCKVAWSEPDDGVLEEALPEADYLPEGTVPLTREQFDKSFTEPIRAFRKLSYVGFLYELDQDGPESSLLKPIEGCLTLIVKFNEALVTTPHCMNFLAERRETDPTLSTLALGYRCFLSKNPDHFDVHYEMHTARISDTDEREGPTTWEECAKTGMPLGDCRQRLYFAAPTRAHCQILSLDGAPIESINNAMKEHRMLEAKQMGKLNRKEEGVMDEEEEGDYVPRGAVPLSKERHRELCNLGWDWPHLKVPFVGLLYERNQVEQSPDEQQLVPIWQCPLRLLDNEKVLMPEMCADYLYERYTTDPKLLSFAIAYRCFPSRDPATFESDYEVHTAQIAYLGVYRRDCPRDVDHECQLWIWFIASRHPHCHIIGYKETENLPGYVDPLGDHYQKEEL